MKPKTKSLFKNVIISLLVYSIMRLGIYYYFYENTDVIKKNVSNYLSQKYKIEFELNEPKRLNNTYHIYAKDVDNTNEEFLVIWKKGSSNIIYDSYYTNKWQEQAKIEATDYFRNIYGEKMYMFYEFNVFDEELLESERVKSMDYKDVIKNDISEVNITTQIYLFVNNDFDRDIEVEKAKTAIDGYLNKHAGMWTYEILYFSNDYFQEFNGLYSEDNPFIWLKDTKDFNKLHRNGKLVELLHIDAHYLNETNVIRDSFFYENKK